MEKANAMLCFVVFQVCFLLIHLYLLHLSSRLHFCEPARFEVLDVVANNQSEASRQSHLTAAISEIGGPGGQPVAKPSAHQSSEWLTNLNSSLTINLPTVFWFIATYHGGTASQHAVMATWGRRVTLHWYTDIADPSLGPNCHVIIVPQGESYNNMFFKLMLTWEHIYANFPEYDFYFRLSEDNYVIVDRVVLQLLRWDPHEKPIVVANLGKYMQDRKAPGSMEFLGGGPGWGVGNQAMKLLGKNGEDCRDRIAKAENFHCKYWCEDVLISKCLLDYGVEFVPSCGWFGFPPEHQYSCNLEPQDLACGRRAIVRDCLAGRLSKCHTNTDYPAIFHYVSPQDMLRIEDIVYNTPCTSYIGSKT